MGAGSTPALSSHAPPPRCCLCLNLRPEQGAAGRAVASYRARAGALPCAPVVASPGQPRRPLPCSPRPQPRSAPRAGRPSAPSTGPSTDAYC